MSPHPLDDPARSSLLGPHASLAVRAGSAIGYRPDVGAFAAWADDGPPEERWADMVRLRGPGGSALVVGRPDSPADWMVAWEGEVLRMVGEHVSGELDPEAVPLGDADVPEMADLVDRTRPGPFLPRTIEFGGYLGLRDADGGLLAMAGERMRPPGYAEVSLVCTRPDHQGRGLGARLVRAVAATIVARGEIPFLHVTATNPAVALYERLGFTVFTRAIARQVVVPGGDAAAPAPH